MPLTARVAALMFHVAGETTISVNQTTTGQLSAELEPSLISGTTRKPRTNKKHQQQKHTNQHVQLLVKVTRSSNF